MVPRTFLLEGKKRIEEASIHCLNSEQHIEVLVLRTLDWNQKDLFLNLDQELSREQILRLQEVLERRLQGEPLQYILGWEAFYESSFEVGPGCLIPRRETEHLVEEILRHFSNTSLKVAELGTGSGNIGISILLKRPSWLWETFEINPESAVWARRNQTKLLPRSAKYQIIEGDFFDEVAQDTSYDLLVANPPYLTEEEMNQLPKELRWEPSLALHGGKRGEEVLFKLIDEAPTLLKPGGILLSEIGSGQEDLIAAKVAQSSFSSFEVLKDFSGLPRVLKAWV